MVMRAQIWLVDFDKAVGSVTRESWPCVIVSPDQMNEHLSTVMVAPMSSNDLPAPFRIPVTFMDKDGLILLDQIRALDKIRLVKRIGMVDGKILKSTLAILREVFEA